MSLSNKAKQYIRQHHAKKNAAKIAAKLNLSEEEVQAYIDEITEPLPFKKKAAFYGITLSIPVLFFVILELVLRSVNYMGNTELFIDPKIPSDAYYMPNPNFATRYFFYTKTIPNPSTDVFLQEKPENGLRIFAMGGSSAAGYPYGYNATFSRVVDDMLTDALPNQKVEVVNVATSAISTYTLYDQVDEILEQRPDAIMIYAGHNEFYGALGVGSNETLGEFPGFVRFYLKLQRFKTFLFVREMMVSSGQWLGQLFGAEKPSSGTLMERIINDQSIELDGPKFKLAMKQFRSNMEAIIEKFGEKGIPVYISTVASNVKNQPPFVSIENGELPSAAIVYKQAKSAFQKGDSLKAGELFEYAKDLDGLKFRAPTAINSIIRSFSEKYEQVKLVPTHQVFEQASADRIIGDELMLEHLHPNQTGYYLMGKTFASALLSDFSNDSVASRKIINDSGYFDNMFISELDDRVVYHRLKTLKQGFPFVIENAPTPYQFDYKPTDFVDSLAFGIVHKRMLWDAAKVDLASYYIHRKQFGKAINEYHGLIRNQPWNDSPYVHAARLFIDQNNFNAAEPYLRAAYELAPQEAFTTKMLGAIELINGREKEAIRFLEESRAINPDDAQMLYNLSGAYGKSQKFEKAMELAKKVEELDPNFPGLQAWKQQLTRIINSRRTN